MYFFIFSPQTVTQRIPTLPPRSPPPFSLILECRKDDCDGIRTHGSWKCERSDTSVDGVLSFRTSHGRSIDSTYASRAKIKKKKIQRQIVDKATQAMYGTLHARIIPFALRFPTLREVTFSYCAYDSSVTTNPECTSVAKVAIALMFPDPAYLFVRSLHLYTEEREI